MVEAVLTVSKVTDAGHEPCHRVSGISLPRMTDSHLTGVETGLSDPSTLRDVSAPGRRGRQ